MIPINLAISGFLSYRDPVEIDFSAFKLACIAGANGAGKSSILDAFTWALFGQARKRDDSIINTRSETAEVSLTFNYEANIYRVIRVNPRGKTTQLEFQIAAKHQLDQQGEADKSEGGAWKTLSERTMRATQARIEETLRLDYETFVNASFLLQGKADQFTQQRPGDRKRILASILGLEIWETYRQRTVEQRKTIEAEIASLDGRLAEINAELTEEQTRKTRLAELQRELEALTNSRSVQERILADIKQINDTLAEQKKLVSSLANQLQITRKREEELSTRLTTRTKERESHVEIINRKSEIISAHKSWLEAREALARWDEIAEQFREHDKRRQEPRLAIESEKARLTQEMETLKDKKTKIDALESSIPDLQITLNDLDVNIKTLHSDIEARKSTENELVSAQEILANANAENPRLKMEMEELKSRIDQLSEADGAACPLCGQPLSAQERSTLVEHLNTIGKTLGDRYRSNQSLLVEANQKVDDLKAIIRKLTHLDDKLLAKKDQANKIKAEIENIQEKIAVWENEDKPRLDEITENFEQESFAEDARIALAKVDAELKEIGYDAAKHDAIRRAEKDGRYADEEFRILERAEAAAEPLENEISNLQSQIKDLKSDLRVQTEEYDRAASKLAAAEENAPDLQQAQRNLLDIQETENRLRLEVGAARQKVTVLDDLKTRRRSFESEREILSQKVGHYKQLERAFGKDGVPALLIESALPQIEAKANDILNRLSGGSMSVQFITQREYKDKSRDDLRETLDIQISDNAGIRDYEMFSGGEAFRVNFAIRLALSEILAQRAGARLQTLVIDEGFGSQDEIGRQRLIEAINTVKADFEKILVITHIESMKEAFPTRIEVQKTDRGSAINIV